MNYRKVEKVIFLFSSQVKDKTERHCRQQHVGWLIKGLYLSLYWQKEKEEAVLEKRQLDKGRKNNKKE